MKTQHFLCIVAHVYVVVYVIKRLSAPTEMQQWVSFLPLSSYKAFPTAVNNIRVISSLCEVPDFFPDLKKIYFFLESPRCKISVKFDQLYPWPIKADGRTDGQTRKKISGAFSDLR
jgi:hypothetical protein